MRAALAGVGLCLGLSLGAAFPVSAQQMGVIQSNVLVIDPERMLLESDYGKRLQAEIQAERDRLIAYNEKGAGTAARIDPHPVHARGAAGADGIAERGQCNGDD